MSTTTLTSTDTQLLVVFNNIIGSFPAGSRRANDFVDLEYRAGDGEYDPLFTASDLASIWDMSFMMQEIGVDATYDWLVSTAIPKKEELERRDLPEIYPIVVFESPLLNEAKAREAEALALEQDQGTLSDIRGCGRCGSDKTYLRVVQDRKADEGPSSVFTCPKCNACWKEG